MNVAQAASGEGISIHLGAPVLGHVFGIPITSTLIMVWTVVTVLITTLVLLRPRYALVPGKLQIVLEALVGGAFDYVAQSLESKELAKKFFPLVMSIFIFVLTLNWAGLIPGITSFGIYGEVHGKHALIPFLYPANTDLNVTLAVTLVAFFAVEISGVAALGVFKYAGKFLNFSSPLAFLIGIIELLSECARLVSFSFRLFGNVFAGEALLLVATFFVPVVLPVPLMAYELFVGLIQAFIFAVLTLFFIKLAIAEPEH